MIILDDTQFYEYILSLLTETGHVITPIPIYANHTSNEVLYFDSIKGAMATEYDRGILNLIDNVSLLSEISWSNASDNHKKTLQILSITVNFVERDRSQNVADVHDLLQKYWNCTHSIVFFKNKEKFIVSFASIKCSHILSDWYNIKTGNNDLVWRISIENMSLSTCENYFYDFMYAIAREYYIYPISFEEASYGLALTNYIINRESSDIPIVRDDIEEIVRGNLAYYEYLYEEDYVEPIYRNNCNYIKDAYNNIDEFINYQDIIDEIDYISFELEFNEEIDEKQHEQFSFEDDFFGNYDDIDSAIFDDPILMIKWIEKNQREYNDNSEFMQICLLYTSPSPRDA